MITRENTRRVTVGGLPLGGGAPILVQSMTNTDTRDVAATVRQINALQEAGCDIVRLSIYDQQCADALAQIKRQVSVPLVADIHFDYRLALASLQAGADKLRINPGNIGGEDRVRKVAQAAKERGVPIRIGVNGGSLERELLQKYGGPTPEGMVESAMGHIRLLEDQNFTDIMVSLKASSVAKTVAAYRLFASQSAYALHLGVTEAGTAYMAGIKSAMGIGALLLDGLGDTLRVSITGDPVREPGMGLDILRAAGLYDQGVEIISCPTCGRCTLPLEEIADEVAQRVKDVREHVVVAVMGCVVNGPGEARGADIGIAGGGGKGVLFKKGEKVATLEQSELAQTLEQEIRRIAAERREVGGKHGDTVESGT